MVCFISNYSLAGPALASPACYERYLARVRRIRLDKAQRRQQDGKTSGGLPRAIARRLRAIDVIGISRQAVDHVNRCIREDGLRPTIEAWQAGEFIGFRDSSRRGPASASRPAQEPDGAGSRRYKGHHAATRTRPRSRRWWSARSWSELAVADRPVPGLVPRRQDEPRRVPRRYRPATNWRRAWPSTSTRTWATRRSRAEASGRHALHGAVRLRSRARRAARAAVARSSPDVVHCAYRPFDDRWLYWEAEIRPA